MDKRAANNRVEPGKEKKNTASSVFNPSTKNLLNSLISSIIPFQLIKFESIKKP